MSNIKLPWISSKYLSKPLKSNKVVCRTARTSIAVKDLSEVVDSCPFQLQIFSFFAIVKLFQTFFDSNNQTSDSWYDMIFFFFCTNTMDLQQKTTILVFLNHQSSSISNFSRILIGIPVRRSAYLIFFLVTGGAGITFQSYLGTVAMDIIWTILKTATSGLESYSDGLSRF